MKVCKRRGGFPSFSPQSQIPPFSMSKEEALQGAHHGWGSRSTTGCSNFEGRKARLHCRWWRRATEVLPPGTQPEWRCTATAWAKGHKRKDKDACPHPSDTACCTGKPQTTPHIYDFLPKIERHYLLGPPCSKDEKDKTLEYDKERAAVFTSHRKQKSLFDEGLSLSLPSPLSLIHTHFDWTSYFTWVLSKFRAAPVKESLKS